MIHFPENKIELLADLLTGSSRICLVGHQSPDGDAVGSTLGFCRWCRELGKQAEIVMPDAHPVFLNFLDPQQEIVFYKTDPEKAARILEEADLLICMDFNAPGRTGGLQDLIIEADCHKVVIDHHLYPEEKYFDLVLSYPEMSSTCELAYYLIKETEAALGRDGKFSIGIAEPLFTGMTTDTNNFSNSTYPSTLMMASELLAAGVDRDRLLDKLYRQFSQDRLRLIGEMLYSNMTVVDGTFSYMTLTRETKRRYNFSKGDVEGVVNRPLEIAGVNISALFTEDDEEDIVRVSMRSRGNVSVNEICRRYFNGGGHLNAAGGRLDMNMDEVPEYFVRCVREYLAEKA